MAYDEYGLNDQAMSAYEEEERRRRQNPTIGEAADQALDRFKGKFTDSNGDFSMGKYVAGQMAGGGMNQPTAMEKQLMQGAGVSAQPGFMTGAQPGVAPVAPQQAQQPMMQPAPQPVNPQQSTYADRVAQNESGAGGYDAIYGYGNAGGDPSIAATGGRNLSELSIGEALKLGDSRMGNNAGALGKYQFLPSTLRGLMGSTGLTEDDKFDAATQEKLFQAFSSANAASLEKQGIQPNETNLALAHAVGAGGAAKLLDPNNASLIAADVLGLTGAGRTTNPQLNKPVSEYLAGMSGKFGGQQPTVASVGREMGMGEPGYGGADNIPTVETGVKNEDTATVLANAHSTVEQLASIVSNPNESKLAKQVALNRMKTLSDAPTKLTEANKTIAAAGEGDASATRDVNNALKPPKDGKNEGSWLKALLLAKLGLGEAATREFALLGIGSTEHGINLDGKKGVVTMDGKGTIIKGYVEGKDGESQDMSAEQIAKANEIAAKDKRLPSTGTRVRDAQGTEWSQVPTTTGTIFYNNAGQRGVPSGKTVPISVGGDVELQNTLQLNKLRNQLQYVEPTKRMEAVANFDALNGTNFSATVKQSMPEFFTGTTAAPVNVPGIRTPVQPQPVAQPQAAAQAPVTAVQPTAPVQQAAPTAPVQQAAPVETVTPTLPTADQPTSPAAVLSERARAKEKETSDLAIAQAQAEKRNALALTGQSEFTKEVGDARKTAVAAIGVTDRLIGAIDKHPELWGKLSSSPSLQAYINSKPENQQAAKTTLFNNLQLSQKERGIADQIMNDYKTAEVAAVTGSGLSASQTNSEKESDRLVGQIGSIENKAEAAKATLTWRRAQHEYALAKAKEWDTAVKKDPNLTPIAFADKFDAPGGTGDKIFAEANKKMEAIIYPKKKEEATTATPASKDFKVIRGNSGFTLNGVE